MKYINVQAADLTAEQKAALPKPQLALANDKVYSLSVPAK